jgi:hypothetical protein
MAIDPDVQVLLDQMQAEIDNLRAGGVPGVDFDDGRRWVSRHGKDKWSGLSRRAPKKTVMAAAVELNGRGEINIGLGNFVEPGPIPLWQGLKIRGIGPASTDVKLDPIETGPLFVSDPRLSGTEFLHWSGIENLKARSNDNGEGDVIQINSRVGEMMQIKDVVLHPGAGGSGIHATRGGQPVHWSNIASFGNSGDSDSGIRLERKPGDLWHSVVLEQISGDNHGVALVYASTFLDARIENLTIFGIKSEAGNAQSDTVVLHQMSSPTLIEGVSVYNISGQANSLVKILPSPWGGSYVELKSCVGGMTNWIDDEKKGVKIPKIGNGEGLFQFIYKQGRVLQRITTSGAPDVFSP